MPTINPTLPADGDTAVVAPYNNAFTAILGVLNGNVDADNITTGAIGLSELSTTIQGFLVPTGMIAPYGGSTAPTGWLLCDGSSYLRASYTSLFAVLGTAYGSADGTHFNVPDLRGRNPIGNDAMGGTAANRVQRSTTLTTTSGSATATVGSATGLSVGMKVVSTNVTAGTTISAISGTTLTLSANATGTGATVAARFSLIADAQVLGSTGGVDVHQLISDQMPSHSHTPPGNIWYESTGYGNINIGSTGGSNAANISGNPFSSTGGDQSHPNLQPGQVVNYLIKI